MCLGSRARPARKADNLTAICRPSSLSAFLSVFVRDAFRPLVSTLALIALIAERFTFSSFSPPTLHDESFLSFEQISPNIKIHAFVMFPLFELSLNKSKRLRTCVRIETNSYLLSFLCLSYPYLNLCAILRSLNAYGDASVRVRVYACYAILGYLSNEMPQMLTRCMNLSYVAEHGECIVAIP
jgi:hypothetical protein